MLEATFVIDGIVPDDNSRQAVEVKEEGDGARRSAEAAVPTHEGGSIASANAGVDGDNGGGTSGSVMSDAEPNSPEQEVIETSVTGTEAMHDDQSESVAQPSVEYFVPLAAPQTATATQASAIDHVRSGLASLSADLDATFSEEGPRDTPPSAVHRTEGVVDPDVIVRPTFDTTISASLSNESASATSTTEETTPTTEDSQAIFPANIPTRILHHIDIDSDLVLQLTFTDEYVGTSPSSSDQSPVLAEPLTFNLYDPYTTLTLERLVHWHDQAASWARGRGRYDHMDRRERYEAVSRTAAEALNTWRTNLHQPLDIRQALQDAYLAIAKDRARAYLALVLNPVTSRSAAPNTTTSSTSTGDGNGLADRLSRLDRFIERYQHAAIRRYGAFGDEDEEDGEVMDDSVHVGARAVWEPRSEDVD